MPKPRKNQKGFLARVPGKPRAAVYRSRIVPSEHIKFLNLAALRRAKKAVFEVGTVQVAGRTIAISAEVHKGMVVGLRPTHCVACNPKERRSASASSARAKIAKAALEKVRGLGLQPVRLPVSVARLGGRGFWDWNDIWILIDWEICIVIEYDDGTICYYCTSTPSFCMGPPD